MKTRGWHRIMSGWYEYTNKAGKTLAYVQRYRGAWWVRVLPLADAARVTEINESFRTLSSGKDCAERLYKRMSRTAIETQQAELKRVSDMFAN